MIKILLSFLLFVHIACNPDNATITGPTIPDVPADPILGPSEPAPAPFNPGPVIDLRSMDGTSAFAICGQDEMTQRRVWSSASARGYGYGRVLSQSSGWSRNAVFAHVAGKKIFYKRNKNGYLARARLVHRTLMANGVPINKSTLHMPIAAVLMSYPVYRKYFKSRQFLSGTYFHRCAERIAKYMIQYDWSDITAP